MIPASENFFSRLGFDADKDLVKENSLFKGQQIGDKLADRVYYYEAPDHTNTSFYFFDSPDLTPAEKKEIHCRIWNENKVDMHLWPTGAGDIEIFYSRTNPKKERLNLLIDRVSVEKPGDDILKRINKWSFDSGTFWLNYGKILDKIKRTKRTVDIELIRTLTDLRKELIKEYTSNGIDGVQPNEIIQALIDRTLFIKFLEDRHIINSYFYKHFFDDESLTYKGLLKGKNRDCINNFLKRSIRFLIMSCSPRRKYPSPI